MISIDKHAISYAPVPKAACTSLKLMFFELENGFAFRNMTRNGRMFHIHTFYPSTLFNASAAKAAAGHWRIAVTRDPVARLLSAYANRAVFYRELRRERLTAEAVAEGATPDPDLEGFIDRLEVYRAHSTSIRHHTDPQHLFLGRDPAFYHRLYQMRELSDLVRDVSMRAGKALALPHAQTGGPKLGAGMLGAGALRKLRDFYAEDYDTFRFD